MLTRGRMVMVRVDDEGLTALQVGCPVLLRARKGQLTAPLSRSCAGGCLQRKRFLNLSAPRGYGRVLAPTRG